MPLAFSGSKEGPDTCNPVRLHSELVQCVLVGGAKVEKRKWGIDLADLLTNVPKREQSLNAITRRTMLEHFA